jgi:outer membrane receptor for ferrienterochelin and colicins
MTILRRVFYNSRLCFALLYLGLLEVPALAQPVSDGLNPKNVSDEKRSEALSKIYSIDYFRKFAPRNALDLVEKVPGFIVSIGLSERGIGLADQNILINGKRIAGKTDLVTQELSRIPAARVKEIIVADSSYFSIPEISGQVLNVVLTTNLGLTNIYELRPSYTTRDSINIINGSISSTYTTNSSSINISIVNDNIRNRSFGPENVFRSLNDLLFVRDEASLIKTSSPKLSARFERSYGLSRQLEIRGSINRFLFNETVDSIVSQASSGIRFESLKSNIKGWTGELAGTFYTPFKGGELKLAALQRFIDTPFQSSFGAFGPNIDNSITQTAFTRNSLELESVLRAEFDENLSKRFRWGSDLEIAYNSLATKASFFSGVRKDSLVQIPLPGSAINVNEIRVEAALNGSFTINPQFVISGVTGLEISEISQAGVNQSSRRFLRHKGKLALTWKPKPSIEFKLDISRIVGQLKFFDFAANINLGQNLQTTANPRLVPPQTLKFSLDINKSFGKIGRSTLRIFSDQIDDPVSFIRVANGGEAIGNVSRARLHGAEISSTFELSGLGIKGSRLDFTGSITDSSIRDPATGLIRQISNQTIWSYMLNFRNDIPNSDLALGFSIDEQGFADGFRLDSEETFLFKAPNVAIFIEFKKFLGLKSRFEIANILDRRVLFERRFFSDRGAGLVDQTERRLRKSGIKLSFKINGAF